MGNQFVGAKHAAARRRRRLVGVDTEPFELENLADRIVGEDGGVQRPDSLHCRQQFSMLPRVVSPRLWKHVAVLSVLLAASISTVFWEHRTGVADTLSITRGIVGLFILLSAQLAWVISWIRSRSEVDFQGRFRCWRWFAVTTSVLAVTVLTETYTLVPELVAAMLAPFTGAIKAARPALVLVTLVPVAILVPVQVLRDMSRCVASRLFLVGGLLLTVIRFMLVIGSADASISLFTLDLLLVLAALSIFASMLLHCRFVAFISNAPPETRQSKAKRVSANQAPPPLGDQTVAKNASVTPTQDSPVAKSAADKAKPTTKRPSGRRKNRSREKAA